MITVSGAAMTVKGVDTTDRTLTGAILKASGYLFACRYVRNAPVAIPTDKEWTRAEVAEKSAAGVRVVANFEFGERPANSKATGRDHANIFLEELDSVGGPAWAPCYFSADYPAHSHDLDLYYEGIAETITPQRAGAYTNGALFRQLKADGLITLAWQSMSKSYPGNSNPDGTWNHTGADIIQTGSGHVAGHACDFNTAVSADYGGWLLGEPNPMEDDVPFTPDDAKLVVNALKADPSYVDLTWRLHAVANALDEYAAGSMKGQPVALTAALKSIPTSVAHGSPQYDPATPGDESTYTKTLASKLDAINGLASQAAGSGPTGAVTLSDASVKAVAAQVADLIAARMQS